MRVTRAGAMVGVGFLFLAACGPPRPPSDSAPPPSARRAEPASPTPAPPPGEGWSEEGEASWYGKPYHGRRTASGEVYNMNEMTAAHRVLAFGTRVKVTRLDNRHSAVVRITDRGPFIKNRIIDLSRAAARRLDMEEIGVARVRLEIVSQPP